MFDNTRKHIVIIGGGIIGLTSAYELSKHFNVTLIEKEEEVCLGASFQNGGVIQMDTITPINFYLSFSSVLKSSLVSLVSNAPSNTFFYPKAILQPNFGLWVKHFFMNTSREKILFHAEGMRQMGSAIQPLMEELIEDLCLPRMEHNLHYTPGFQLSKVSDPDAMVSKMKKMFDSVFAKQYLAGDKLNSIKDISGIINVQEHNFGLFEPNNMTVNTRKLGLSLKRKLEERSVKFVSGEVTQINTHGDQISGVELLNSDLVQGDLYVVSAGYQSNSLLNSINIRTPLMPIKAYSLHLPDSKAAKNWKYAVHIDSSVLGLFIPYRESPDSHDLRVTGIRDMDGCDGAERPERVAHLKEVAHRFTGEDWNQEKVRVWCGIMPVSPDDFPMIGGTSLYENLYMNVGHGFRGTAYSLPSARLLSQIITDKHIKLGQCKKNQVVKENMNFCFDPLYADPARFGTKFLTNVRRMFK